VVGAARRPSKGEPWPPLVDYRHGLRASELVDLRCGGGAAGLPNGTLHVRRVKKGTPSVHPISGDELRALRRLQREQEPKSPFVLPPQGAAQCGPCAAPQD